jgi:hypothetical protein
MSTTGDSSLLVSSGVFQHELTQNFLDILSARANSYLEQLYSVCYREPGQDRSTRYNNYLIGLKDIESWGNDVLRQEVEELTRECPNIKTIYTGVVRRYMADYFKGFSCKSYEIRVPSLLSFVHMFYKQLSLDESIRSMEIFRLYSFSRKYVFMDAMRRSLYQVLKGPVEHVFNQLNARQQSVALAEPSAPQDRGDHRIPSSIRYDNKRTPNPNSVFQHAVDSAMKAVETPAMPTYSEKPSTRRSSDFGSASASQKKPPPEEPQTMPSLMSYQAQREQPPASRRFSRLTAEQRRNSPPETSPTHKSITIDSASTSTVASERKHSPRYEESAATGASAPVPKDDVKLDLL